MPRVLLADDNLTVQRMVATVLRGEGMSVTVVDSGPVALDSVRNDPPDLILTDFDLEGMNVAAFAKRVRTDAPTSRPIPIVALMSPNDSCDPDRLNAIGIQAVIKKPIDSHLLRQTVNRWMPAPSAETVMLHSHSRLTLSLSKGRSWLGEWSRSLSLPRRPDHHPPPASPLNDNGKAATSLTDPPSPMMLASADIPATIFPEPAVLSDAPEGAPTDPTPPHIDLSPAAQLERFEAPDLLLSSDTPEAKVDEKENPADRVVSQEVSPAVSEKTDPPPVFCPIVAPAVADAVDASPEIGMDHVVNTPSPTGTASGSHEAPPTPPLPEISTADLHAAVETEIAARLPEMIRVILTPEVVQTALEKVARDVVPAVAEVQLPEVVRAILTPETIKTALEKAAREIIPPIAEAEIIKEIQRLEPKVS